MDRSCVFRHVGYDTSELIFITFTDIKNPSMTLTYTLISAGNICMAAHLKKIIYKCHNKLECF